MPKTPRVWCPQELLGTLDDELHPVAQPRPPGDFEQQLLRRRGGAPEGGLPEVRLPASLPAHKLPVAYMGHHG